MSTVNRIVRTFVAASLCVALCDSVLAGDAPWSGAGPYKVGTIASLQLTDAVRGRTINVLVRYPEGPGPYPVIIFSHGSFSNKDTFSPASEHWAGYGYVVIHPNHADARGGTLAGGLAGRPSPDQTRSRSALIGRSGFFGGGAGVANGGTSRIERIRDISSVLDSLDQVEAQIPALRGKLLQEAVAVAGHSFGAYVAQCQGGVKTLVDGRLENLSDPRVKCVVPISAQGESQSYGLTGDSWTEARTPAMHITGTRDRSAPNRPGGQMGDVRTKVVPFERSPAGGKYLLIIEGATHLSFGGRLGDNRGGADAVSLTKIMSLAFLEAYLRHDEEAKAWLDGEASSRWIDTQAELKRKL